MSDLLQKLKFHIELYEDRNMQTEVSLLKDCVSLVDLNNRAKKIALDWARGVDDAECAIRKLNRLFPIDAEKKNLNKTKIAPRHSPSNMWGWGVGGNLSNSRGYPTLKKYCDTKE